MRRLLLILMLALGWAAGSARADGVADAKAGMAAHERGDRGAAMRLYTQALASSDLSRESEAIVHNNRGLLYADEGRNGEAIADYDAAIRIDPDYAVAYYNRGLAYYHLFQPERALADYSAAIRLKPDYATAYLNRGNAHRVRREYEAAVADETSAIRYKPDSALAHVNRAVDYFALGQLGSAAADLEKGVRLAPSNAYYVVWLHIVRSKLGGADTAELKRNVAGLDRGEWPAQAALYYLGQASAEQVRKAGAAAQSRDHMGESCEASFYLAESELAHGNRAAARKLLEQTQATCTQNFWEHTGAQAELKLIK